MMNTAKSFTSVLDGRKRKVRNLWQRGDRFYARIKIAYPGEDRAKTRRVPLKASNVTAAVKELRELLVKRDKGRTITRERTQTLADFAACYIDRLYAGNRKRLGTIVAESGHARFWTRELGSHRLHVITPGQINRALDKRVGEGKAPRTLNYALTTLRNIYAEAKADGLVDSSPCQNVKWRKVDKKERRLVTADEFDHLGDAALKVSKNGHAPAAVPAGSEKSGLVVPLIVYALISIPTLWWLWRLLTQRSNHRLGLLGERAVGEELNKLMLEGCHVYHDFKKDNGGNIDHVVVASSGVYCIETKCRRKGGAIDGRKDYEIVFDGERLHFPHTTDSYGLDQTKGNSSHLGQYLSSAIGEKVYAKGILTFPGWFVTTRKPIPNVRVLNPKQIRKAILGDKQGVLNGKQIKQIVHQLDQKCRDVEF